MSKIYNEKVIAKRKKQHQIKNEENKFCFRCGAKLTKSPVQSYTWYCPYCDEEFCDFEQARTETNKGEN